MKPILINEQGEKRIKELISPMIGLPVMNVYSGIGRLFTVQLGQLEIKDARLYSDWRFFFDCPWEIYHNEELHVSSRDSRENILHMIRILEGKLFLELRFVQAHSLTIVVFNNETYIHAYHAEADSEGFGGDVGFFMPGGYYLTIGPGNYWSLEEYKYKNI